MVFLGIQNGCTPRRPELCNLALRSITSCRAAGLVFGVYSVARPSRVGADALSHQLLGHEAGASPSTDPRKTPSPAFSTASRGHVVRLRQAGHNRRPRDSPEPNSGLWGGRSGQLGGRHSEDASNVTPGPIRKAGRNETSLRDYPLFPNKSLLPAELRGGAIYRDSGENGTPVAALRVQRAVRGRELDAGRRRWMSRVCPRSRPRSLLRN